MKNNQLNICKQCGKTIVGTGKLGLCDRCFNKDGSIGIGAAGIGAFVAKKWGKQIVKFVVGIFKK